MLRRPAGQLPNAERRHEGSGESPPRVGQVHQAQPRQGAPHQAAGFPEQPVLPPMPTRVRRARSGPKPPVPTVACPKRPWKNLADFCRGTTPSWSRDKVVYPCLECKASGQVIVERDSNTYEGRNTYGKCPDCKGTKEGTKAACLQAYRASIQLWQKHKAHYQETLANWQAAQAKLTNEERYALIHFGVEHGVRGQQRANR